MVVLTRPGPKRVKRRYGIPFEGFTSSVPAHMCPPGKVWGAGNGSATSSINMAFDPVDGKFYRRPGYAVVGGTSGLLESVTGTEAFKARKLIALESPSLTDGYPTHAVLFTDEALNMAQLNLLSTNGSVNYTLGEEFHANHYPGSAASSMNIKCVPYYRTTTGTPSTSYGRLASADTRAYALAGSRGMQEGGDWVYFPCLNSAPMKWNRRFNETTDTGNSENLRLMPTGAIPPLGYPAIADGTTVADGGWRATNIFYYSVAYQYEDGSVSMPMIPRPTDADSIPQGYLTKTVAANCEYLTWSKIPIGPHGVVGRWLLRTPRREEGASGLPAPLDLFVTAYIPNNTQTTYVDTNYSTLGLSTRPDIVRFDRILPPAARHIGNFDGRYVVGYTKPNPAAIVLAPMKSTANVPSLTDYDDDNAALTVSNYEFAIDSSTIKFYKDNSLEQTITFTGKSIQWVVDQIHRVALSANNWSAAILAGADGSADASNLATTASVATGDTSGRIRAFSSSYPAIAYYSSTYLGAFPTEKRRWFFTAGGPGLQSNLADSYVAANYRTGLSSWGNLQGFAPLLDGCLIFFTKAVVLFRNIKSGKSGLDDDYHPDDLFTNVGCIAWDSIAYGDGWAGCLTDRGYCVFDGTRGGIKNISLDVYNPDTGAGEWAYEISKCQASCGKDDDNQHFHAKVMGGTLYVTYRSSSAIPHARPDRMLEYSFSGSSASTGLDQVLRPDGKPWGWSTPQNLNISVMGEVRKSGGIQRYGVQEFYTGVPESIVQFETTQYDTTSSASGITGELYLPIDFAESLRKKQAEEISVLHKGNGGNGAILAVSVVAGGTGYLVGDILTLSQGTSGTVTVTTVSGSTVTGVSLTTEGSGFTVATKTTTGGTGSGCTVAVTHLNNNLKLHYYRTNGVVTAAGTGSGLVLPPTGSSGTFLRTVVPLPLIARSPAIGSQIRFVDTGNNDDTDGEQSAVWGCELDLIEMASYD